MPFESILWDLDDDPHGNSHHIFEHGITKEEVEELFQQNTVDDDTSRSTGRPVIFGTTSTGRHLMVVYEIVGDDMIYPITAFEVPEQKRKRKRGRR